MAGKNETNYEDWNSIFSPDKGGTQTKKKKKQNIWAAQPQRTRDFEYIKKLSRVKSRYAADSDVTLEEFLNSARTRLQKRFNPTTYAIDIAERYDSMTPEQRSALLYDENLGYESVQQKNLRQDTAAITIQNFNNDYTADWATAAPSIKRKALIQAAKNVTLGGPFGQKDIEFSKGLIKNPEFALATAQGLNDGKITERQLAIINEAMNLLDYVRTLTSIQSETAFAKTFNKLSPNKQEAVLKILDVAKEKLPEAREKAEAERLQAEEDQNPIIGWLGTTAGGLLQALIWANDQAQHIYRTQALAYKQGNILEKTLAPALAGFNIMRYWSDVETGDIDSQELKRMKTQYGVKEVKIVREFFIATMQEDGFANLNAKYANDNEALYIIDQILDERVRTDKISKLIQDYKTISNDDLGNIVANILFPDDWRMQDTTAGGLVWDYADMGVNFAGVFFGDPTLVAGKVTKGYKLLKYGLVKDTGLANIEKILNTTKVKRFVDQVAPRIDELNMAETNADAMRIRESIKRDFGKYLTDDAVDSLSKFFRETEKTFDTSSDAFNAWMREADGVERLLMGRPVRATEILAPRMTRSKQLIIQRRLRKSKTISFDGSDQYIINLIRGRMTEDTIRAEFGLGPTDDIAKLKNNPDFAQRMRQLEARIGTELLADVSVQADLASMFGISVRKANRWSFSTNAWRMRTDNFLKYLERAPMKSSIKVSDASDADLFYAWARTTLSRTNASYLRELWIAGSEGQRRLMLASMFGTIADAKGIVGDARQAILTSSMRNSEKYARTFIKQEEGLDGTIVSDNYNPSVVNNRSHGIHAYQFEEYIKLPDFAQFQILSEKVGILEKILGFSYRKGITGFTNWWSTWNLIGPKYIQRNTLEDVTGYMLTGGRVGEFVAGKLMTQTLREVRGKTTGVTGEAVRRLGTRIDKTTATQLDNEIALADDVAHRRQLGKYFMKHLDADEILEARKALMNGNAKLFTELMGKALVRNKIGLATVKYSQLFKKAKFTKDDMTLFSTIWSRRGDNAIVMVDDTAELSGDINNFAMSDARTSIFTGRARKDLKEFFVKTTDKFEDVKYIDNPDLFVTYWYKNLHAILHSDGVVGQHVFRALLNSKTVAEAEKIAVPKIIESLKNGEFPIQRSTLVQEVGIEDFARRYFEDSVSYLADGSRTKPNVELIKALAHGTEDGETVGKLYLMRNADGTTEDFVDMDFIKRLFDSNENLAPKTVLAKVTGKEVVEDTSTRTDRLWSMTAEAYGRISREPIYFARLIPEWKALRGALLDKYKGQGLSDTAAENLIMDLAERRAQYIATSYMDNPKVRSVAAFSLRNVARYYRATEDFGRRIIRSAKYNPESIQKLNLLVGAMDDNGFTYTDENGDTYFIYPGTGVLHQTIAAWMNFVNPTEKMYITSPYVFGGKTSMLTPSADPDSWLPTFSSPIAGFAVKAFELFGPIDIDGLTTWLLGPKAVGRAGTTDEKVFELLNTIMPSHFRRAFQALPFEDMNGIYANAVKGAIQIAGFNGELDPEKLTTPDARLNITNKIGDIAFGTMITKLLFGFLVPASPQMLEDTGLSAEARKLGIDSFRAGYLELLNKYEGNQDYANAVWYKLNPGLLPFTVSKSGSNVIGLPASTQEALNWYESNKDFVDKYMYSSVFLAPGGGEFAPKAYRLLKSLGYSKSKDFEEMLIDVATAEDAYMYWLSKDAYEADLELATNTFQKNQIDERWRTVRDRMFAKNPLLERAVSSNFVESKAKREEALAEMRTALTEIDENSPQLENVSSKKIKKMIAGYDAGVADFALYKGKSGTFYESRRSQIKDILNRALVRTAGKDDGATRFYERILKPLIEGM